MHPPVVDLDTSAIMLSYLASHICSKYGWSMSVLLPIADAIGSPQKRLFVTHSGH
jgi:hypothetical protein